MDCDTAATTVASQVVGQSDFEVLVMVCALTELNSLVHQLISTLSANT